MQNPDLHRPVRLEHVEQPLTNSLFLLRSGHRREIAGVEVRKLVPGLLLDSTPVDGGKKTTATIRSRKDGQQRERRGTRRERIGTRVVSRSNLLAKTTFCGFCGIRVLYVLLGVRRKNIARTKCIPNPHTHSNALSISYIRTPAAADKADVNTNARHKNRRKKNAPIPLLKHSSLTEDRAWCLYAPTKFRARLAPSWCCSRPWS